MQPPEKNRKSSVQWFATLNGMISVESGHAAQLAAGLNVVLLVSAAIYFFCYNSSDKKFKPAFVVRGHKGSTNLREIVETAWTKNKEHKYILQLPFRRLFVLPVKYVNDYAWEPEHKISSNIDLRERLLGKWTLLGSMTPEAPGDRTHEAISYIKYEMSKNMSALFPDVYEEIHAAIDQHIGDCPVWSPRVAYELGVKFNLRIFERVFVGLDLCRNDKWLDACLGYSTSAIATAAKLMQYSWWIRPIIAPFLQETKSLKKHIDALEDLLRPVLNTRLHAMRDPDYNKPHDFVQWWVDKVHERRSDNHALTAAVIQLNIAGIQSTGMVLMQTLFDLAARPEYVKPLREELQKVMAEEGAPDLSPRSTGKLQKMDSFLKESQRHVAQNILSVYRKVMQPLTLQDGTILPSGSYVSVPSIDPDVSASNLKRDFDGFRWERLRQLPGNEGRYLSVSTGHESLEFGHGSHACPGRFFATNVIKATIATIILKYDLKLKDGESNPEPKYNKILVLIPDKTAVVEFRKRANLV